MKKHLLFFAVSVVSFSVLSGGSLAAITPIEDKPFDLFLPGSDTLGTVQDTVQQVGSTVDSVSGVVGNVSGVADKVVSGAVGSVTGSVSNTIGGAVGSVSGAVGSVTGSVSNTIGGVVGGVSGAVGSVTGSVSNTIGGVVGGVSGAVGSVTGSVSNTIGGAVGSVSGAVGSVTGSVSNTIGGVVGGVTDTISGSLDALDPSGVMDSIEEAVPISDVYKDFSAVLEEMGPMEFSAVSTGIPTTDSEGTVKTEAQQVQTESNKEAQLQTDEEVLKQNEALAGDGGCGTIQGSTPISSDGQTKNYTAVESNAYDYVEEEILKKASESKFAPPQKDFQTASSFAQKEFFLTEKNPTSDKLNAMSWKRSQYLNEVATKVLSLSTGIRSKLKTDSESITGAPTNGCNQIEDIQINTKASLARIKQTVALIGIGIANAEVLTTQMLLAQPLELMAKPEEPK